MIQWKIMTLLTNIGNVEFRAICDECPSKDTIRLTNGYFDAGY